VAACGGDAESVTVTEIQTTTVTATTTVTEAATVTETETETETAGVEPDLATRTFQMPSGNVGCLFGFERLRCDILSGLDPEPAEACDFDWVGVDMGVTGAAAANCGSDTVYDAGAPTLAYGSTWGRSGIVCESSQGGLRCTNGEGHELTLARGSWSAS
jgi:hypothetical protein